jgi:hypothetical protein
MATRKPKKTCASCDRIKECGKVTEEMIRNSEYCDIWSPATDPVLRARREIVGDFGLQVLRYGIPAVKNRSHQRRRKARRRRKNV